MRQQAAIAITNGAGDSDTIELSEAGFGAVMVCKEGGSGRMTCLGLDRVELVKLQRMIDFVLGDSE